MAFDGWMFWTGGSHSDLLDFGSASYNSHSFSPSDLLGDATPLHDVFASHGFDWRVEASGGLFGGAGDRNQPTSADTTDGSFLIVDTPYIVGGSEAKASPVYARIAEDLSQAALPTVAGRSEGRFTFDDDLLGWQSNWGHFVMQLEEPSLASA